MAVQHDDKKALALWAKEIAAAGTGGTPGQLRVPDVPCSEPSLRNVTKLITIIDE